MSRTRWVEPVMGTVATLILPGGEAAAAAAAFDLLRRMDARFSTYREDSDISRLGDGRTRLADCAGEVAEVLDLCAQASALTGGYFTACPGGRLDPSGLVKGWAADAAVQALQQAGVVDACLDVGGDVLCLGSPGPGGEEPWRVGVADPHHRGSVASVVPIGSDGGAVATSGDAERGGHVLDPFTGRPARHWASLSILAGTLTWADTYATAALAMGPAGCGFLDAAVGDGRIIGAFGITAAGDRCRHGRWP